jgi:ABC-type branched-subunit amino acid transport system substrate-binding protein
VRLPRLALGWVCLSAAACIAPPPARPDNALVVGALLPFSGDLASSGLNLERPLWMVGNLINGSGGVRGQPLAIVSEDSHMSSGPNFNIELGIEGYRKLAKEGARALIGPKSTDLAKRLSGLTSSDKVVYFPGSIGTRRTLTGSCAFDLLPNISVLSKALARQMISDGVTNLAIVYVTDEYGEKMQGQLQSEFEARGGKVVAFEYVSRGQTDFKAVAESLAEDLEEKGAGAVALITYPIAGAGIIQEVLAANAKPPKWYLAPTLREPEFVALVPPGVLDGAIGVSPGVEPDNTAFDESFQAAWSGDLPRLEAYYYYDMAAVLTLAMISQARESGDPGYAGVCEQIRTVSNGPGETVRWDQLERAAVLINTGQPINYQGLSGPVAFDPLGNLTQGNVEIWKVEDNALKTAATYPLDSL